MPYTSMDMFATLSTTTTKWSTKSPVTCDCYVIVIIFLSHHCDMFVKYMFALGQQMLIFQTETGNATCKCGANTRNEIIDTGDAGNWPLFPVTSLRLGDTNDAFEYIDFRIGPLVCKQGKLVKHSWRHQFQFYPSVRFISQESFPITLNHF